MSDFFISYTQKDVGWAQWIAGELEASGYSVVLQDPDFRPGANFVLEMHQASARATRTIAVLSPAYLSSCFTQPEWAAAFVQDPTGQRRALVPVRVCPCELTGLLSSIVYIDLVGLNETAARDELIRRLELGSARDCSKRPTYPFPPSCTDTRTSSAPPRDEPAGYGSAVQTLSYEELVFIIDWIVETLWHIGGGGRTFGEYRRLLAAVDKLHQRVVKICTHECARPTQEPSDELSDFVVRQLAGVVSETDFALPQIGEERVTRDWTILRKQKTIMRTTWDILMREMRKDRDLMARLSTLRNDEPRCWKLLGFASAATFSEYVSPTFDALQQNCTPLQRKLLASLVGQSLIDVPELIRRGYPKALVIETLNSLIRSELVRNDDGQGFRLTEVGAESLRDYLRQQLRS